MLEKIQYREVRVQTCTIGHNGGKALHILFSWRTRIITSSVSRQDEPNLVLWLAIWADKMELSCPLRIRALSCKKNLFIFWCFIPYNKSFTDQACSVKMAEQDWTIRERSSLTETWSLSDWWKGSQHASQNRQKIKKRQEIHSKKEVDEGSSKNKNNECTR